MEYLHHPHLPDRRVTICAVGEDTTGDTAHIAALEAMGMRVVRIPSHPDLPRGVAHHCDLLLHPLGGNRLLLASCSNSLDKQLRGYGFDVHTVRQPIRAGYPGEVGLNCFSLGGALLCHPDYGAEEILAQYADMEYQIAPVRQGYAKCSVCIVDGRSAITADEGLAHALRGQQIDVLRIRPGHIRLPGYAYGFIGGCGGLIDRNLLAFTGDVSKHPDGQAILDFCRNKGVRVIALTEDSLLDIGGILPLLQENEKKSEIDWKSL